MYLSGNVMYLLFGSKLILIFSFSESFGQNYPEVCTKIFVMYCFLDVPSKYSTKCAYDVRTLKRNRSKK
jgi:hypothetical protein